MADDDSDDAAGSGRENDDDARAQAAIDASEAQAARRHAIRARSMAWVRNQATQRLCYQYLAQQLARDELNQRRSTQLLASFQRKVQQHNADWIVEFTLPQLPTPYSDNLRTDLQMLRDMLDQPIPCNDLVWIAGVGQAHHPPRPLVLRKLQLLVVPRLERLLLLDPAREYAESVTRCFDLGFYQETISNAWPFLDSTGQCEFQTWFHRYINGETDAPLDRTGDLEASVEALIAEAELADRRGCLLTPSEELSSLKDYFTELYQSQTHHQSVYYLPWPMNISPEEVQTALRCVSGRKALPPQHAPAKLWLDAYLPKDAQTGYADDFHIQWDIDCLRDFRNACSIIPKIIADLKELGDPAQSDESEIGDHLLHCPECFQKTDVLRWVQSKHSLQNPCQWCGAAYQRSSQQKLVQHGFGAHTPLGSSGGTGPHRPSVPAEASTANPSPAQSELAEDTQDMEWDKDKRRARSDNLEGQPDRSKWAKGEAKGADKPDRPDDQAKAKDERCRQTARLSRRAAADTQTSELKEIVSAIGRLLRLEDTQAVMNLDNEFVVFLQTSVTGNPWSITTALYDVACEWHAKKEQSPTSLSQPMRNVLLFCMLKSLQDKLEEMETNSTLVEQARTRGLVEGTSYLFLQWDGEAKKHIKATQEPLEHKEAIETVRQLVLLTAYPNVVGRFHATRRLTGSMESEIVPFTLVLQNRSAESHRFHALFSRLARQHDAAEFLQQQLSAAAHPDTLAYSWQARVQTDDHCVQVVDQGNLWPMLVQVPLTLPGAQDQQPRSIQSLIVCWRNQAMRHALTATPPVICLQLCRFDSQGYKIRSPVSLSAAVYIPVFVGPVHWSWYHIQQIPCAFRGLSSWRVKAQWTLPVRLSHRRPLNTHCR
ncbi:unnamed protein product [Symbiodinium necroappetens]|uniref:C2H2-type domain-containing protein n=1 Tax=Symbiodinium necroappetens TaxID=1628268 RepID=A0A812QV28_9DINO|nr:unnamed protein product [Symbiodinium necroappetens]